MSKNANGPESIADPTIQGGGDMTAVEQTNAGAADVESFAFHDLNGSPADHQPANLDFILDIPLDITVQLGRTKMMIHDLLKLGQGSVIELSKPAGDTLEIMANSRLIAKGDVVVMNDKYGIRLTEVISPVERLEKLK
jgi:flagellar motor switch protein FliN/FliY